MGDDAAARDTDGTEHGGFIVEGSDNVKINAAKASYVGANHLCGRHGGGPLRLDNGAALTVLINHRPAMAKGGAAYCPSPMDKVKIGSGNVFYTVSNTIAGLLVTQDRDGVIHIGKKIKIKGPGGYGGKVMADAAIIGTTDVGAAKLNSIDRSKFGVTIVPAGVDGSQTIPTAGDAAASNGTGSDTRLEFSPENFAPEPGVALSTTGAWSDVSMFHELCHAERIGQGIRDISPDPYWQYVDDKIIIPGDEALYRIERGFPVRTGHDYR